MLFFICMNCCANIIDDSFDLTEMSLRTQYVGTLSVTPSAGRTSSGNNLEVRSVSFSNDNAYIALGWYTNDNQQQLMILENKTLRVIAQETVAGSAAPWIKSLNWNPIKAYGKYYVAIPFPSSSSSNFVYIYSFDGQSLTSLPNATITTSSLPGDVQLSAQWSPNGQWLAVATGPYLSVYSFNGSNTTLIDRVTYATNTSGISWSHDGKYVGFLNTSADAQIYSFNGITLTPFCSTPFVITPSSVDNFIRFNPVYNVFAICRYLDSGNGLVVRLYSYTDAGVVNFLQAVAQGSDSPVFGGIDLSWSPDGNHFVYGSQHFYFYSFDGTTATFIPGQTITWLSNEDNPIEWGPDGTFIGFGGRPFSLTVPLINGISNSIFQLWNTGLVGTPSFAEATSKATLSSVTNIVTSTVDQYWGITTTGDLKFSSTEAVISRMRGSWVSATSQGSLINPNLTFLMKDDTNENFYALDVIGRAHQATSVIVGPQVRINWSLMQNNFIGPVLTTIYRGPTSLMGLDASKNIYKYRTGVGWVLVGQSPLH